MPALKPTDFTARIVWLGRVPSREAALDSQPVQTLALSFAGPEGEDHGGLTRPSCSRVLSQYPRDTEIRNVRQLSVISQEELEAIATEMGLASLDPAWLGATLVIAGIPDFTLVPPSSRLQGANGATITLDMENRPCQLPAKVIAAHHPEQARLFKRAATGRRGVTAWVEREGTFTLGEELRLHVPDQPVWPHMQAARGALV